MKIIVKFILCIVLLVFIIILENCKKITINNITERDQYGNIIGNVNSEDWKLDNLSSYSSKDRAKMNELLNEFKGYSWLNFEKYKVDCGDTCRLDYMLYPNPLGANELIKDSFSTNCDGYYTYMIWQAVNSKGQRVTSGAGSPFLNFSGETPHSLGGTRGFDKGFTIYYCFSTKDSCLKFGKGNVMVK